MKDQQQNVGQAILGYYKRNKKKLLREAIEKDNVQLSNKLIALYESLGESLDDVLLDEDIIETVAEKATTVKEEPEENLSIIFARKLR